MKSFSYIKKNLFAERVPLSSIAKRFGTPLYVYSKNELVSNFKAYEKAFRGQPHLICFALKANSSHSLLKILATLKSGADIVSGGEMYRALKAGIPSEKITFAGVGKTREEIREALKSNILLFNVESEGELRLIAEEAARKKRTARISIRVNPDIDPGTHPYISTGLKEHKFGVTMEAAPGLYKIGTSLPFIEVCGIHMHLGSQIRTIGPFVEAVRKILGLVEKLESLGIRIRYFDMGGGLGIDYEKGDMGLSPSDLASSIRPLLKSKKLTLLLEPGRSLIANAGILLTKVLYMKNYGHKRFVVVDAGMNDLIRPSLYDAVHRIAPVKQGSSNAIVADIVGPVCETGDFLARDRTIECPEPGDLLAVFSAGAYGFSMSSNYNSRLRPAEVLVDGSRFRLIRKRESLRDLIRHEI